MHVPGVLQPWREVRELCAEHDAPFFCDAAQWIGKLPAAGLGECDFVSGCAHKFGGPQGVGFLKCPARKALKAQLVGGPQEEGRRAGTENGAGVLSMMAALAEREGVYTETTSAAALAGLERLVLTGVVGADEMVLVPITGTGLKDTPPD